MLNIRKKLNLNVIILLSFKSDVFVTIGDNCNVLLILLPIERTLWSTICGILDVLLDILFGIFSVFDVSFSSCINDNLRILARLNLLI